jgi:hypothetical protein
MLFTENAFPTKQSYKHGFTNCAFLCHKTQKALTNINFVEILQIFSAQVLQD